MHGQALAWHSLHSAVAAVSWRELARSCCQWLRVRTTLLQHQLAHQALCEQLTPDSKCAAGLHQPDYIQQRSSSRLSKSAALLQLDSPAGAHLVAAALGCLSNSQPEHAACQLQLTPPKSQQQQRTSSLNNSPAGAQLFVAEAMGCLSSQQHSAAGGLPASLKLGQPSPPAAPEQHRHTMTAGVEDSLGPWFQISWQLDLFAPDRTLGSGTYGEVRSWSRMPVHS